MTLSTYVHVVVYFILRKLFLCAKLGLLGRKMCVRVLHFFTYLVNWMTSNRLLDVFLVAFWVPWTGRSLGARGALAGRSLGAHWALTGRPLDAHWTLTGRSLDAHWTLTGHSLDTHWTLTGHSLDSHWTLTGRSLDAHWTLAGYDTGICGRMCENIVKTMVFVRFHFFTYLVNWMISN